MPYECPDWRVNVPDTRPRPKDSILLLQHKSSYDFAINSVVYNFPIASYIICFDSQENILFKCTRYDSVSGGGMSGILMEAPTHFPTIE